MRPWPNFVCKGRHTSGIGMFSLCKLELESNCLMINSVVSTQYTRETDTAQQHILCYAYAPRCKNSHRTGYLQSITTIILLGGRVREQ